MKCLGVVLIFSASSAFAEFELLEFTPEEPAAAAIIQEARGRCLAETESADIMFSPELAITPTDLDGDLGENAYGDFDDLVLDFNYMTCRLGNIWAGTGGAPVHFVVDGTISAGWTGFGWQVVRFNAYQPSLILLGRHGSYCDGYGAQPCVQAISVDEGIFSYVQEPGPFTSD